MVSPVEISDRYEIQQLLVDYVTAIDRRRFDDLDAVFVDTAYIDYRAMGGIDGEYPQIKAWLAEVLPNFATYAHMLGLPSIRLHDTTGDSAAPADPAGPVGRRTAAARTFCLNPMVFAGETTPTMLLGLWYEDEFIDTPDGWRISRRVETKCFASQLTPTPVGQ